MCLSIRTECRSGEAGLVQPLDRLVDHVGGSDLARVVTPLIAVIAFQETVLPSNGGILSVRLSL